MKRKSVNSYTYKVRAGQIPNEDGIAVPVYGIEVWENQTDSLICAIEDVFTSRCQAKELAELCNRLELDPIHLYDVIEDALVP